MKKLVKNVKFIIIVLFLVLFFCVFLFIIFAKKSSELSINNALGVWWWHKENADNYLNFAHRNGVDEIYYCDYSLDENTAQFVSKAKSKGFRVYVLWGEKEWILDKSGYDELVEKFKKYQIDFPNDKLEGIHLDVEPHQYFTDDITEQEKIQCFERYVEFVNYAKTEANIKIDFDIAFWFDNIITFNGETKEVYKFVIDFADRTFVMSYRDSAENIYDVGKDEMEYAKLVNKEIFLSVETKNIEETPQITFYEEGKKVMYEELRKLENLTDGCGVSIHHIESWYELKN